MLIFSCIMHAILNFLQFVLIVLTRFNIMLNILIIMLTKMFCTELQHTYITLFNTDLLTDTESHKSITTY